jgi:hypothetical protein
VVHRAWMSVRRGRSLAQWSWSITRRGWGRRWFQLPSLRRPIPSMAGGPRGCVLGATAQGLSQGLGRSSAATPSAMLPTRPLGHKPLGAGWPAPQQSIISPAKKICPDRCGAATLNPAPAPTHQPCPSRRFLTRNRGRSVHEQRRSAAAPSGIASPSGCVTAPGAGDAFPPGPQSGPCCAGSPARGPMGCPGGAG